MLSSPFEQFSDFQKRNFPKSIALRIDSSPTVAFRITILKDSGTFEAVCAKEEDIVYLVSVTRWDKGIPKPQSITQYSPPSDPKHHSKTLDEWLSSIGTLPLHDNIHTTPIC